MLKYNKSLNLNIGTPILWGNPAHTEYKEDLAQKKILLIGNGFDLRANLKSSFKDFVCHIVYYCALYNYKLNLVKDIKFEDIEQYFIEEHCQSSLKAIFKDSRRFEILKTEFEDVKSSTDDKTYLEYSRFIRGKLGCLLFSKIFGDIYQDIVVTIYSDDTLPTWDMSGDFNCIYGKGFSINSPAKKILSDMPPNMKNKKLETFVYIVEQELSKSNISLWLDVESVLEMIITNSDTLRKKYSYAEDDELDYESIKEYLKGLKQFEDLLAIYLKRENDQIKKDYSKEKTEEFFSGISTSFNISLNKRSHCRIDGINIEKADIVINYNYTSVAEDLFKQIKQSTPIPKFYYVNGSIDIQEINKVAEIDNNVIIGYSSDKEIWSQPRKELFPFEKQSRRILKNTEYIDINKIVDNKTFDLIILGHSCGLADQDIIKHLLSHPDLKTAVVLCYSLDDLYSIYNNIKSMLDSETFSSLMEFSPEKITQNLYFAVDRDSLKE